ncbi:hypothetical protein [Zavarzinella formosa]|nr:hypothetical protein [Zavarzinella formosa]
MGTDADPDECEENGDAVESLIDLAMPGQKCRLAIRIHSDFAGSL